MNLILASSSPRRRQLLETVGIPIFSVRPANIIEKPLKGELPHIYCIRLAKEKCETVSEIGFCTLAADTIVCKDVAVFEKPLDDEDAYRMLKNLSNGWHSVISAWHFIAKPENNTIIVRAGHSISKVLFRPLTDTEIYNYIKTGEPKDKAGSYGIQGLGAVLVKEISGSYSNIVGLPLQQVLTALHEVGIHPEVQ